MAVTSAERGVHKPVQARYADQSRGLLMPFTANILAISEPGVGI